MNLCDDVYIILKASSSCRELVVSKQHVVYLLHYRRYTCTQGSTISFARSPMANNIQRGASEDYLNQAVIICGKFRQHEESVTLLSCSVPWSRGHTNAADVSAEIGISCQSSGASLCNRTEHVPECTLWTDCMQLHTRISLEKYDPCCTAASCQRDALTRCLVNVGPASYTMNQY